MGVGVYKTPKALRGGAKPSIVRLVGLGDRGKLPSLWGHNRILHTVQCNRELWSILKSVIQPKSMATSFIQGLASSVPRARAPLVDFLAELKKINSAEPKIRLIFELDVFCRDL